MPRGSPVRRLADGNRIGCRRRRWPGEHPRRGPQAATPPRVPWPSTASGCELAVGLGAGGQRQRPVVEEAAFTLDPVAYFQGPGPVGIHAVERGQRLSGPEGACEWGQTVTDGRGRAVVKVGVQQVVAAAAVAVE